MKAADIPDSEIYRLIRQEQAKYRKMPAYNWCADIETIGAVLSEIERGLPQFPKKIVIAKLRQMIRKKRLEGCDCGCRGDFLIPEKIREAHKVATQAAPR